MSITSFDANILSTIFSFCTPKTKKEFRLVCKLFYQTISVQRLSSKATDSALLTLHSLKYISSLTVANTRVSDVNMFECLKKLNLSYLNISNTDLGDLTFFGISQFCKKIQRLDCSHCKQPTDTDFLLVAKSCNQLRTLIARSTKLGTMTLSALTGMICLDAANCQQPTDLDFRRFIVQNKSTLTSLDLSNTQASSGTVGALVRLKSTPTASPVLRPMSKKFSGVEISDEIPFERIPMPAKSPIPKLSRNDSNVLIFDMEFSEEEKEAPFENIETPSQSPFSEDDFEDGSLYEAAAAASTTPITKVCMSGCVITHIDLNMLLEKYPDAKID